MLLVRYGHNGHERVGWGTPPPKKTTLLKQNKQKTLYSILHVFSLVKTCIRHIVPLINEKLHETTKGKNNWDIKTPLLQIL